MKLSAEEYCQLFRMDQPGYNFNRQEFSKRFGLDFLDSLRDSDDYNPSTGYLKYRAFKKEVAQAQKVFNEISAQVEKAGKKPLSQGLWNVFYASYVIESRKALFKDVQDKIDHKKKIAAAQWAPLKGLSEKLHSDEDKTKIKPSKKGKRNP